MRGVLARLQGGIYVGCADDPLTQTGIQVLRMEAEKDVAGLPELVDRIQELLLDEGRGSIVAEIWFGVAIYSVPTVDVPGSVDSHRVILRRCWHNSPCGEIGSGRADKLAFKRVQGLRLGGVLGPSPEESR